MKKALKIFTLIILGHCAMGQHIPEQIDSIVRLYHKAAPDVGISIGFVHDNEAYYTAYGTLSRESTVDINENSIFEITSITKILTANMLAQAALENKLHLEDHIDGHLPEGYTLQKNLSKKIKLSDLAAHSSGLPDLDFRRLIELDPQQPVSSVNEQTLLAMINECSDLIDYGNYRYSTVGYTLLGQVLEKSYGKTYDEIIHEKIIEPLQLTNTLTTAFNVENRTIGYNPEGGVQEFFEWNVTAAAGLVKSNAVDMVSYLKALLSDDHAIGRAALLTEKVYYQDANRKMGLGVIIITDDKNTLYLKSGDSMGQSSMICYNRAKNWGIIILLNQRNSRMREQLLNDIYEAVLK